MDDVQDSQKDESLPLRQIFRSILDEGEQKVPSTTPNIMASLRQEQQKTQQHIVDVPSSTTPVPATFSSVETPLPKRRRNSLYSVFAFTAVAAVLVASFGLCGFILRHPISTSSGSSTSSNAASSGNGPVDAITRYPSTVHATTETWSAVIITYQLNGATFIANYDPATSISTPLISSLDVSMTVNGVSHDGHEILYSVYDGFKTSYYIYPQATKTPIFTTSDRSRSAIWSADDRFLFISTAQGIMSIDAQTYTTKVVFPVLMNVTLLNYREDGYLYFVRGNTEQPYATDGTFNRINTAQEKSQQITPCVRGTNFWLSPSGVTVYYNCPASSANTLYAVNSDGTNSRVFRSYSGAIIGYAKDGSPLTLENSNGKYQVVRKDVNVQQDTVLVKDVAPQTTSVTKENIAVAPYGQTLVAKATYSNSAQTSQEQFWYCNLTTGSSRTFSLPRGASSSQVIGWDKLKV